MLSYTSIKECEIKGTIKLHKKITGLGFYTDIYGNKWDIKSIIGKNVQAVPLEELHPYYTDTSGTANFGWINQTWYPYKVEIVKKENNE